MTDNLSREPGSQPARSRYRVLRPLYIGSIAFDPLLFFLITDSTFTGVSVSLSRVLQLMVMAGVALRIAVRLVTRGTVRLPWLRGDGRRLYSSFWSYLLLAIAAGLIGLLSGAYTMQEAYDVRSNQSGFSRVLNSAWVRPLFEYLIALYYFLYYVVLAPLFLRTRTDVTVMFRVFSALFIISFLAAVADLVSGYTFGVELIPRHLSDGRGVGTRFHGLAGEPRTAFVYLFLGWSLYHLRAVLHGRHLNRWVAPLIIAGAVMTQSTSGLVGLGCFALLFTIYSTSRLTLRRAIELSVVLILVAVTATVTVATSSRIGVYAAAASATWAALEDQRPLPSPLDLQRDNIYPLYDMVTKVRSFDWLPVLIGSGLGSASAVNNRLFEGSANEETDTTALTNPNAQVVRVVYETGLLGTFFFVMTFVQPVRSMTRFLSARQRRRFMVMVLLLVGCALGTRSAAPYIYVGILIAAFRAGTPTASTPQLSTQSA